LTALGVSSPSLTALDVSNSTATSTSSGTIVAPKLAPDGSTAVSAHVAEEAQVKNASGCNGDESTTSTSSDVVSRCNRIGPSQPAAPGNSSSRGSGVGGLCFLCGSTDHWQRDCPRHIAPSNSRGNSKNGVGGLCFLCGSTDHWQRDCPQHAASASRAPATTIPSQPAAFNNHVTISRVDMAAEPYELGKRWHDVILPRLYRLVDFVETARRQVCHVEALVVQ
jgi:hypothetical protein